MLCTIFPKKHECNTPAEGLSVRMLAALALLVYCSVCVLFRVVLSSSYIGVCFLHARVSVRWSKSIVIHVLQRKAVATVELSACRWRKRTMSANKTKKVKMATKSCPECDQQIPVACKSCPCGYVFISRKLLNAKLNERSSPAIADKLDFKRRRTERIRRERIDSSLTNDMENRRRSRANSQSDPIRRGRGRPKTVGLKKQEEEKEKQEKEVDIYASLSDEKAFVFSVALAEINRKILGQRLIL